MPVEADSEAMAAYTDRTFAFTAASLASCRYPERARKPTVANTARIATTTTSSTSVNQAYVFFLAVPAEASGAEVAAADGFPFASIRGKERVKSP